MSQPEVTFKHRSKYCEGVDHKDSIETFGQVQAQLVLRAAKTLVQLQCSENGEHGRLVARKVGQGQIVLGPYGPKGFQIFIMSVIGRH